MDRPKNNRRMLLILGGAALLIGGLFLLAWASKKAQSGSAQQAASADQQFSQAGGESPGTIQLFATIVNPQNSTSGIASGPQPPTPVMRTPPTASTSSAGPLPIQPRINPSATASAQSATANSAHAAGPVRLLAASSHSAGINGGPIPPSSSHRHGGPIPPQRAPGAPLRRLPPVRRSA